MSRRPEEWEIVRRSIAMLTPGHPTALHREAALELLDELRRMQRSNRHLAGLLKQLQALLAMAEAVVDEPGEPQKG